MTTHSPARRPARPGTFHQLLLPSALFLLALSPIGLSGQTPARLAGAVADNSTGTPIATAEVVLLESAYRAVCDSAGTFLLDEVPAGSYMLEVRATGYRALQQLVVLRVSETRRVELALEPVPFPLPPLPAEAARAGDLGGFWKRREQGQGYYLTRQEIAERGARRVADLFRGMPGIRFFNMDGQGGGTIVSFGRSDQRTVCAAVMYVNGVPFDPLEQGIDAFRPEDIEAIEAYPGPARLPAQFNATARRRPVAGTGGLARTNYRTSQQCGVIVLWLRVGGAVRQ